MELSERLAMLFHELEGYRLSYIRMSRDMGKASSYVGSLLNGQNKSPSEDFYSYLQMRFNANPEWLRTGKGDMFLEEASATATAPPPLRKCSTTFPRMNGGLCRI